MLHFKFESKRSFPNTALVIRSLNTCDNSLTLSLLEKTGWVLLPSRQIWRINPYAISLSRDLKADRKLFNKYLNKKICGDNFSQNDFQHAAELYNLLYREKYPALNPQ